MRSCTTTITRSVRPPSLPIRWYEFDIGWIYIRMMSAVGLAHVRKVAPALKIRTTEGEG